MKNNLMVLALGLLVSAHVHAENPEVKTSSKSYLLGSAGVVSVSDYCEGIDSIPYTASSCGDKAVGFKLGAGYNATENFAVEVGVNLTGDLDASIYDAYNRLDASTSVVFVSAQAVARVPIGQTKLVLKGGLAHASVDFEVDMSGYSIGSGSMSETTTSTSPMLSVALEVPLKDKLGAFIQYDYLANVGDEDTIGETDIGFVNAGLKFDF